MSSEFNSCATLMDNKESVQEITELYENTLHNHQNPFQSMLTMQTLLQKSLKEQYPDRTIPPDELQTKGDLIDFLRNMQYYINDEFSELIEACHGMSRPASERTAAWKPWKGAHESIRNESINENLTEEDKLERAMEMIDIMHFVMNALIALDIDAKTAFQLYVLKNNENLKRWQGNY